MSSFCFPVNPIFFCFGIFITIAESWVIFKCLPFGHDGGKQMWACTLEGYVSQLNNQCLNKLLMIALWTPYSSSTVSKYKARRELFLTKEWFCILNLNVHCLDVLLFCMVSSFTYPLSFSITMEKLKVYQKYFEWDFRFEKDHRDHSVQLAKKKIQRGWVM